ncbi:MAG: permease [Alkaliphilus sp.]|nr:MAG: permease [Alkaliphilus sp.]
MITFEKLKKNKVAFLVALVYLILLAFFPEKGVEALNRTKYFLLEMVQILPVIFMFTVVIEAWIPKEVIVKKFGDNSGFSGNALSLLLGSISAGPIYAAFPIAKMLLKKGASITNIVIILSSWAVIKVPMLANEAKFLGAEFMAVRWILTVISILVMGYLISLIVKKEDLPGLDSLERTKKLFEINEDYCIGCAICAKIAPKIFAMVDDKAKINSIPTDQLEIELVLASVDKCPTKAIIFENYETGSE